MADEVVELVNPDDLPFDVGEAAKQAFALTRRPPRGPVDPVRAARGRRNRRNGNAAAREWADLVGGENVGVLSREDVRQESMLWEVKSGSKPSLAKLEAALDQVAPHAARRNLPYGVAWRLPDRPLGRRWLVVLRAPEWLELREQLPSGAKLVSTPAPSEPPAAPRGASKRSVRAAGSSTTA